MKNAIILVCLLFLAFAGYSQVGIGTKNPDTTSVLDLSSTTKGLLIPRMTTVQRNAIISPAMGLQILNVDDMCLDIYDGRQWIKNCGKKEGDPLQGASRSSISDSIWTKDGAKIFPADPARIGIGTEMPDSSALLDIASTSQGFLMPRMTTAQRDLIVAPAVGLQIINLDDLCLDIYDGTGWIKNCGMRLYGQDTVPVAWIHRDDCPGGRRSEAVAFAIGGKGYIGTGDGSSFDSYKKDFWEYNSASKCWSQIANIGGEGRRSAVGFSIGNKGYVGTGATLSGLSKEFWEYNPLTNVWTRLADFIGTGRDRAVGFSLNGKGYIGTGNNGGFLMDFYEYDPLEDDWTDAADFGGGIRADAVAFSLNGKGYVGTGTVNFPATGLPTHDFWQYDPNEDYWIQVESLPVQTKQAVAFTISGKAYVGTGLPISAEFAHVFYKYDPSIDQWSSALSFPGTARHDAVSFSIGDRGYVGTGEPSGVVLGDFWEYREESIEPTYDISSEAHSAYSFNDGIWNRELENVFLNLDGNVGIGENTPANKLDLNSGGRGGVHPTGLPMYVTGFLAESSNGVEFRQADGTQGIGFGFNTMYAAGSHANQDLGLKAKGVTGGLKFLTNNTERVRIMGNGNVGIGTETPASSALLDIASTSKGFLMPRMTTAQRDLIAAPAVGLQIINLDDFCLDIYDGTGWIKNCGMRPYGQDTVPVDWIHRDDCPGGRRSEAVAFAIGGKGYVGTGDGSSGNLYKNDFWEYNSASKCWSQIANFGGGGRHSAVGFSIGNKGYVGTGLTSLGLSKEFWEYNPLTNVWTRLADFKGTGREGAVGFSLNGKGYIGTGNAIGGMQMDFYEYDPLEDNWTDAADYGGGIRADAVAFSLNGKGYVGTGTVNFPATGLPTHDFWKYDPIEDYWIQVDSLPVRTKQAVAFTISGKAYVGTGLPISAEFAHVFYKYDPSIDQWSSALSYPGTTRHDAVSFSIGDRGYVGTGDPSGTIGGDFWEYREESIEPTYDISSEAHSAYSFNDGIWNRELENVFLNLDGNVGIGTNNPLKSLHVEGSAIVSSNLGIGLTSPNNNLDINSGAERTGETHPTGRPLYVTGNILESSNGIEFRHIDGTKGIGFGYNTIYATGSQTNQDLGLMARGSGILKFTTNNTERMRIQGDGNVGIGTTTPHAPLQFKNIVGNRKIVLYESVDNDNEFYGFGINGGILRYQVPPSTNHVFYAGTSPSTSAELMRITGTGNIGIGTPTPATRLQISNGTDAGLNANSGYLVLGETNATNIVIDVNEILARNAGGSSTLFLQAEGGGGVRIGGSSPTVLPLYVTGDNILESSNGVEFRLTNGTQGIGFGYNTMYATGSQADQDLGLMARGAGGILKFTTNNLERMRIQGDGNVSVGVPLANNKLDINSGVPRTGTHQSGLPLYVTGNLLPSSNGIEFRLSNGMQGIGFGSNTMYAAGSQTNQDLGLKAKGSAGTLNFTTNNLERMVIKGNGNIGIGTSTPNHQLELTTNDAFKIGTAAWVVPSDTRLKKDIEPFTDGLDLVRKINPIWFRYNGLNGITDTARFAGIIAQEIQKIAPYMISTTKSTDRDVESYLSYDANAMTYILVNAVKEQQILIDSQQAMIESQQVKFDELQNVNGALKSQFESSINDLQLKLMQMEAMINELKAERNP